MVVSSASAVRLGVVSCFGGGRCCGHGPWGAMYFIAGASWTPSSSGPAGPVIHLPTLLGTNGGGCIDSVWLDVVVLLSRCLMLVVTRP